MTVGTDLDLELTSIRTALWKQQEQIQRLENLIKSKAPTQPTQPDVPGPPPDMALGTNLMAPTYWTRDWVFTDIMLQAKLNEQGFYTVYVDSDGHYPKGEYTPAFVGSGSVEVKLEANRIKIVPTGEVKNLKVWMPGYAPGQPRENSVFHELFLDRLIPFKTLRFMDWQHTNNAVEQTWEDRTKVGEPQNSKKGAAIEYMIALCNEQDCNAWFCMPHNATTEYVRRFARLVKRDLAPHLKVYIEYSNEVWNNNFDQGRWVKARAGENSLTFHEQWAAGMEQIWDVWSEQFGVEDFEERVIRVLAGQERNVWHAQQLAELLQGRFDVLATSAYFSVNYDSLPASPSYGDMYQAVWIGLRERQIHRKEHKAVCDRWKYDGQPAPYIAYEGGQHLVKTNSQEWSDFFIQFNRSSKMETLCTDNLKLFKKAGGSLFMNFQYVGPYNKHGSWGLLEYQDEPLTPKYKATVDFFK